MIQLFSIATVILTLVAFVAYKLWSANREIERMLKTNAELEQTKRAQAVTIQTQNAEIKNAQIQRKNSQSVQRSNASTIDQQLHAHGWFRAEDDSHGVRGVQPDLSKPCRHGGDQAADTCPQSDSSGDL